MPKRSAKEEVLPSEPSSDGDEFDDELDINGDIEEGSTEPGSSEEAASEGEDDVEQADSDEEELREALVDYMATANQERTVDNQNTDAGEPGTSDSDDDRPADPGSDSSEDERPSRNTIGNVPLVWYKDEDHIGYDREGGKLIKAKRKDKLDALLARNDSRKALRTIYDEYNDEEITLSKEELAMIMRIRKGQFPHLEVNPFEPYNDYFSREEEQHPLSSAPEPKRRFIPSKHEEKKIIKLVRAIRKGWLKTSDQKQQQQPEEPPVYMLWADDGLATDKTAVGLSYIPAPKPKLPGHDESYNPPAEYLPSEEERAAYELMDPQDRPKFIPQGFSSLRAVPLYADFINERFERCLDLYLCPRVRKKRMFVDPQSLVPKLPKPRDLQPFPTSLAIRFMGHKGRVRSIAADHTGQWLASGGDDCTLRLWEVSTGRCMRTWQLGSPVLSVAWCPNPATRLLSAVADKQLLLLPSGLGGEEVAAAAEAALKLEAGQGQGDLVTWQQREDGGLEIVHKHFVKHVAWHVRGDYFSTVAPTGSTQAVLVHQLSKRASQNPFRKNKGQVQRVAFHPSKPFFFVATQNHVRVYNLAKQGLAKKLIGGSGVITSLAVHPSGDHVVVGSEDKRLAWYDLDLSAKPYKALRYHQYALRSVAFHRAYPLFASASDDGTCHVFHGMVYADMMTNPLIVPVKILRGHEVVDFSGVTDCTFHPTQPWVFTAGADASICLWCN